MSTEIGKIIQINEEDYEVTHDFEEMLILTRNGHYWLNFPSLNNALFPCGKVRNLSKIMKQTAGRISLLGVTFPTCGYNNLAYNAKDVFMKVSAQDLICRIRENGELLAVIFK